MKNEKLPQILEPQVAGRFDETTLCKILQSAKIAAVGIIVIVGPILVSQVETWLSDGTPINWRRTASLCLTAVAAWAWNAIREWRKGSKPV